MLRYSFEEVAPQEVTRLTRSAREQLKVVLFLQEVYFSVTSKCFLNDILTS